MAQDLTCSEISVGQTLKTVKHTPNVSLELMRKFRIDRLSMSDRYRYGNELRKNTTGPSRQVTSRATPTYIGVGYDNLRGYG